VKKPGVGWATCCPPTGKKQDIATAIEKFLTSKLPPSEPSNGDTAAIAQAKQDLANNDEPEMSVLQDSEGSSANDSLPGNDKDAESQTSTYELHAKTLDEVKMLAETLGVKEPGVGWAKCCPPSGNKQDIVAATEKFLMSHQLLTRTVDELKVIAEALNVKKPGVGWATCCPPTGKKQDIATAIEKFLSL